MIFLKKHYRDIVFYKALCNLRSEASKTYLSFLWWILEPVLSMAIYYFIFGVVFQRGTEDFIPFLLVGLVVWQWFAQSVSHCSVAINQNYALISQVNFPKVVLPSINIVMDTFKFSIVFTLLLITLWIMGYPPTTTYIYLPVILGLQFLLNYACGMIASALIPFVPDFSHLIPHLLRLGMYGSGILYAVNTLPQNIQEVLAYNPMVWIIQSYRDVLMYAHTPSISNVSIYACGVITLYTVARVLITKLNPIFARALMQR
ncbi:ABC transporter permease [Microbulbifer thermotolerans]|uniref:Transport permease protein n=2 Tax=Microbulbifer thermotolerans TaxID=252514 RepID=A0AB35HTL1_MICTH|nr:ABC transporter permease [Microbulbifer thermotolerans]MCX2779821.1 ABC transporter permease [Microbulbifer thermotolerans]MCX2800400.1 ABC transporter permease [Microbulbifer thermotolerans]MCX2805007.1 ABC transporter permease [Microbulbifer thermotolerans]